MNSSNHCRTIIFEGDIKFQYVMGEYIHNTTQNAMLTFFMDEWV